jgi:hypothetical protein
MGGRMKHPLVLFAAMLPLFTPPASAGVPELNATAVCKARAADAEALRSAPLQTVAECVQDEKDAKQQLSTQWESTSVSIRNRCQSDGRSLGTTSYLDLLACIQIAEDEKSGPKKQEPGKR